MKAFTPDQISIIVPVYNAGPFLSEGLESLRAQTHAMIDVILVDDGSSDDSRAICERFAAKDPRFRVFSQANGGPGSARNAGMERITGEFFGFMDADDTLDPCFCERMIALLRGQGADIAVCDFEKGGRPEGKWPAGVFDGGEILREFAAGGFFNRTLNKIYRSASFGDIRFPEGMDYAEDAVWTARALSRATRVVRVPDPLYHYRFVETSLTNVRVKSQRRMCAYYVNVLARDEILLDGLRPEHAREREKIAREALDIMTNMLESWFDLRVFDAYDTARAFARRHEALLHQCALRDAERTLRILCARSDPRAAARAQRLRALCSPAVPLRRKARLLFRAKNHIAGIDR